MGELVHVVASCGHGFTLNGQWHWCERSSPVQPVEAIVVWVGLPLVRFYKSSVVDCLLGGVRTYLIVSVMLKPK